MSASGREVKVTTEQVFFFDKASRRGSSLQQNERRRKTSVALFCERSSRGDDRANRDTGRTNQIVWCGGVTSAGYTRRSRSLSSSLASCDHTILLMSRPFGHTSTQTTCWVCVCVCVSVADLEENVVRLWIFHHQQLNSEGTITPSQKSAAQKNIETK